MSVYLSGATKAGWCCATNECHRMFFHRGHPRRGFARFLLHRALSHGQVSVPKNRGVVDLLIRRKP